MLKYKIYIICLTIILAIVGSLGVYARALSPYVFEHQFGRGDLWRVVNYLCVPAARIGLPYPCASVHPGNQDATGWAILPVGTAHVLTVPTEPVSGIESPVAQAPRSAQLWQAAWDARTLVEGDIGRKLPRSAIGLAINSAYARTQDQFHIHTSCVRPTVRDALEKQRDRIGPQWTRLLTPLEGVSYMVRRLDGADLGGGNIVDLLPAALRSNSATMARQTLVVVGATFDDGSDGYYVLNTQAGQHRVGDGESLLDFECR
jgi:CDP-diacylglycerol pyrophosphatase